ncbi:MAG: hypothetical protein U1E73_06915 [Planctomycetota bacterium]
MAAIARPAAGSRPRRTRRALVLVVVVVLVAAALVGRGLVWTPIPLLELAGVPPLAAPLRTPAQHDALYAQGGELPFVVECNGRSGQALVLGLAHTNDPASAGIAALRTRLLEFGPTLVLVEGTGGWHFGGVASLVERHGETGAAQALAQAIGARCRSLEPDPRAEVAHAIAAFGREKVLAFYFLRVFASDRDRAGAAWTPAQLESEAQRLLRKRGASTGLGDALPDVAAFDAFWRADGPAGQDWRTLPAEWLWRGNASSWLGAVAERINEYRDRHFVAGIAAGVAAGERVFAACGKSHAILIEPALRAAVSAGK